MTVKDYTFLGLTPDRLNTVDEKVRLPMKLVWRTKMLGAHTYVYSPFVSNYFI